LSCHTHTLSLSLPLSGYGGYDCSQRTCPHGRDPTEPGSAAADSEEEFTLECQADAGYFTLTVLGRYY
jgi:hypothetical protein